MFALIVAVSMSPWIMFRNLIIFGPASAFVSTSAASSDVGMYLKFTTPLSCASFTKCIFMSMCFARPAVGLLHMCIADCESACTVVGSLETGALISAN